MGFKIGIETVMAGERRVSRRGGGIGVVPKEITYVELLNTSGNLEKVVARMKLSTCLGLLGIAAAASCAIISTLR